MAIRYLKYLLVVLAIIVADQTFKLWVHSHMSLGEEIMVLGEWFRLYYVLNPGFAYGLQIDFPLGKPLLSIIRILAVIGLSWYLIHSIKKTAHRGLLWTLTLILGGATGNMIDSVFYGVWLENNAVFSAPTPWLHGQVIDMLYFPLSRGTFPEWVPIWGGQDFLFFRWVFNIADAAVSLGFVSLLLGQNRFFRHDQESTPEETGSQKPVILFDGVCNFCNSSVNFIMARDPKAYFLFTANQSEAGQKLLAEKDLPTESVETIVLVENGKVYTRSTAALRIARHLSFPWKLTYGFIIVPRFLRDMVYDLIAKYRYRWFGKREACRIPSPEERARFLD